MKLAWSNLAKLELLEPQRYFIGRWGRDAAQRYLEDVRAAVKSVCVDPNRARPLNDPYRIIRVRSHCLIVHVDKLDDCLTIARVLHTAMDIARHLP